MVVRREPTSLFDLSLQSLCPTLLKKWRNTYFTNYYGFVQEINDTIPVLIRDKILNGVVKSHVIDKTLTPGTSALIDSIISCYDRKLDLNCLRNIGAVQNEEIELLQDVLTRQMPCLRNLTELSLQTSNDEFTLPICTDEILDKIGSTCSLLTRLNISYNIDVTDVGLQSLIPSDKQIGCPNLFNVFLLECSVTHEGIAFLLEGLPKLETLGYRETGQSLRLLLRKSHHTKVQPLQLAHLNNLGRFSCPKRHLRNLKCSSELIVAISELCPKLNGLRVRVTDWEVSGLHELTSVNSLELSYHLGKLSSPGFNTVSYLQHCGAQFVQLSFVSETFSTRLLKVICEQCYNLKRLYIKCNDFCIEDIITVSDKERCVLTNLEEFMFRAGYDTFQKCDIPSSIFHYVLHKSLVLTDIVLTMRSNLLTDIYIANLFSSIETSKIKTVGIRVPVKDFGLVIPGKLTMMAVETLIGICPELTELNALSMWDVSSEEIKELKRQLRINNSALFIQ